MISAASKYIREFNEEKSEVGLTLQPEFGNWMVEAVPADPYDAPQDINSTLSIYGKMKERREVLSDFFQMDNIKILSLASPPMLGTPNHILVDGKLEGTW